MIAFARKNLNLLILKYTSVSPPVGRSPIPVSASLHFFSTSSEEKLGTSPALIDLLVHKHKFPPELASRVASVASRHGNPENVASVGSFFKEFGFSDAQLEKAMEFKSHNFPFDLEDCIKPKIKILQDLGISCGDICRMISTHPPFLRLNLQNNIIPSVSVLKGLLGSNNLVSKVLRRSPRLLAANLQNTVLPNVEFLKSCAISMERIRIILIQHPQCFSVKPEVMRKCAEKTIKLGLGTDSTNFIYAITTFAKMSDKTWDLKLQCFRDLGFSDDDILSMFRKNPDVFSLSVEKIKKVTELLIGTGKFSMSSIVSNPSSFDFSIEKRYIPRLRILGILESKNLIKKWPCLQTIYRSTDDSFSKQFIIPYLNEVNDVYYTKSPATTKGNK